MYSLLVLLASVILYLPFIGQYTNTQIQVIYDSNNNGKIDSTDLRLEGIEVEVTAYDNDEATPNLGFTFLTDESGRTLAFNPVYPNMQVDIIGYSWFIIDIREPSYRLLIPWSSQ